MPLNDEYDDAFASAASDIEAGTETPITGDEVIGDEIPAEAPAEEVPAEAPSEAPAEEVPAEIPAEAPAEEVPAEAPAEAPAEEVPAEAPAAPLQDPYERLSPEDRKVLEDYEAEFPEIHKAESIRQQVAMERAFNAFSTELAKVLSPMLGQYGKTAEERHIGAIAQAHPDYQTITPGIMAWVNKQPQFLKDTYTRVLTDGETRDVIDLIGAYKSLHSAAPASAASVAPSAAAAAALAPVATKRSDPPAGKPDENDYDSAFAEAARSLLQ